MQRITQWSWEWRILDCLFSQFAFCCLERRDSRRPFIYVGEKMAIASPFVLSSLNFTLKIILLKINHSYHRYPVVFCDFHESLLMPCYSVNSLLLCVSGTHWVTESQLALLRGICQGPSLSSTDSVWQFIWTTRLKRGGSSLKPLTA